VHEAVLAAGERESGCTVHLVDNEYDHGPIIAQRRVPVLPGDSPETLAERIGAEERELYPWVIRRIAEEGNGFIQRCLEHGSEDRRESARS
jgi:phosphoribosylglycinamide formyltransferase-1